MKNEKKKKGGKFPPKGDTTQKRRQSRRREKLNEIAKAHGFASWSAYETAVINGMARLTKRAADGANCPPNSKVSRHAPPLTQTVRLLSYVQSISNSNSLQRLLLPFSA